MWVCVKGSQVMPFANTRNAVHAAKRARVHARARFLLDLTSTQAPVVTPRAAEINVVMVANSGILPISFHSTGLRRQLTGKAPRDTASRHDALAQRQRSI